MNAKNGVNITSTGIRMILGIVSIIVLIGGVAATYGVLNTTVKENAKDIAEIKPVVAKNKENMIEVKTELKNIQKTQERMEKKVDRILNMVR